MSLVRQLQYEEHQRVLAQVTALVAERDALKAAMEKIAGFVLADPDSLHGIQMQNIAKAALKVQP